MTTQKTPSSYEIVAVTGSMPSACGQVELIGRVPDEERYVLLSKLDDDPTQFISSADLETAVDAKNATRLSNVLSATSNNERALYLRRDQWAVLDDGLLDKAVAELGGTGESEDGEVSVYIGTETQIQAALEYLAERLTETVDQRLIAHAEDYESPEDEQQFLEDSLQLTELGISAAQRDLVVESSRRHRFAHLIRQGFILSQLGASTRLRRTHAISVKKFGVSFEEYLQEIKAYQFTVLQRATTKHQRKTMVMSDARVGNQEEPMVDAGSVQVRRDEFPSEDGPGTNILQYPKRA